MTVILEAAELKFALQRGYIDLSEVKAWADKHILESEIANADIIELTLSKTTAEAVSILGVLSCKVDQWRMLRQFFKRFLRVKIISQLTARDLSEYLYNITCYDKNCPKDMKVFYHHHRRIEGAIQGWGQESEQGAIQLFLNDIKSIAQQTP
jgi:hypothetical protein